MTLQIQIQIHIGILDRRNRFNMIHSESFRYLFKIRRGHVIKKPRDGIFNRFGLLMNEFVNVGFAGHVLDIDIVGRLPGRGILGRDAIALQWIDQTPVLMCTGNDGTRRCCSSCIVTVITAIQPSVIVVVAIIKSRQPSTTPPVTSPQRRAHRDSMTQCAMERRFQHDGCRFFVRVVGLNE